jgi:hypothetical protein
MPEYPGHSSSLNDMKEYYFAMAEWYSCKDKPWYESVDFYLGMAANMETMALDKSYWD